MARTETVNLFQLGDFTLHSGDRVRWKIECDALTYNDLEAIAIMMTEILPPFGYVIGVPKGGMPIATALRPYQTQGPLLIVDDVLTTGRSMEETRVRTEDRGAIGAVIFARGRCPEWVVPLFSMSI